MYVFSTPLVLHGILQNGTLQLPPKAFQPPIQNYLLRPDNVNPLYTEVIYM